MSPWFSVIRRGLLRRENGVGVVVVGLSGSHVANGICVGGMSRIGVRVRVDGFEDGGVEDGGAEVGGVEEGVVEVRGAEFRVVEVGAEVGAEFEAGLEVGVYVAEGRNFSFIQAASIGGRRVKCFCPRI